MLVTSLLSLPCCCCLQVFQSEFVVKEFDSIMSELRQLSSMASRFPDFDLPGKEMFLDKVWALADSCPATILC